MDSDETIQETPYGAAMSGDWKSMIDNEEQPLKDLLEIVKERAFSATEEGFLKTKNRFGNTVLHEATIYGNYEAVRLLVERSPDLISIPNVYGETPLFTAAGYGEAKIVEFLIRFKPEQCVDDNGHLISIHIKRSEDDLSILGAAIIGQHFETALLLLELDESLHSLKDKNGITALQLLAHMPSAFESGFPMGIFERLVYCCLPVRRKVEFQVKTSGQAREGVGDIESGWGSSLERKPSGLLNYFKVPKEENVWEIINQYPHAVEQLNEKGQSILDVAVMHRQKKIFNLVKQLKVPLARLHRVIDKKKNTLLHHVADMEHYRGGTKPGPALKLQEELRWFEQVQKVIPSHYVTLRNKERKTAEELFKENHKDQLTNAQKWIKETTQSCSTVAALVATVVFAAAYTVPGGSDKNGKPNFINSPYFLLFTVSDVLSLASSLTSLVVFLSLLTSPFQQQEFHISLPRKLLVGFTFLFFAVITTMLSFGATILILIQSEKKLTTLLLSMAAFLPVLVFAIMQFSLYVSFMGSTYNILKITGKALPSSLVPCLPREKKLCRSAGLGKNEGQIGGKEGKNKSERGGRRLWLVEGEEKNQSQGEGWRLLFCGGWDKVNNITPFRCFISSCLGIYNNAIPSLRLISGLYLRHSQEKLESSGTVSGPFPTTGEKAPSI
uniref:PGG domain-containing protein n=1 Tax=Populus alba TaxID=43335 RepID=A0A4U5MI43_POPAL|nr:hypothetical protein D5086_0000310030 [Populus alba]